MKEEDQELFQMSSNEFAQNVSMIKGKRTKRSRPLSPLRLAVTSSSSCGFDNNNNHHHFSSSSPSSSIDFAENIAGEEEDMANCLILLAQGNQKVSKLDIIPSPTPTTTTTMTTYTKSPISSSSAFFYQCKTCNKSFSSFQALGGHRASHKKPYMKSISSIDEHNQEMRDQRFPDSMNTTLSLQISSPMGARVSSSANTNTIKSNKVHECSICGAEFSSGQALGGHMRRHRAAFANTNSRTATPSASLVTSGSMPEFQESKKRRISLELDLNLPAPTEENDHRESKFHFTSKEQVLVFSASSLVDCHY